MSNTNTTNQISETNKQIHTLLACLTDKQTPPFAVLLLPQLHKITFDFSPISLTHLQKFCQCLQQKGMTTEKLYAQQGGQALLMAIAVYLGEYLAHKTDHVIVWYDYQHALQEIAIQNQQHNTNFHLEPTFGNSLIGKIGDVYCQPLIMVERLLMPDTADELGTFVHAMQTAIFAKAQVHLFDEPNQVAYQYLAKIKTGKLLDPHIGFFAELQTLQFDYSEQSLTNLDKILTNIQQKLANQQIHYQNFIQNPSYQKFCYLLGFYIGMTASRLANVAVKWANFEQMTQLLGDDFSGSGSKVSLENRFLLLMENHYRMPMLVITNRLFGIAPNFPATAIEFYQHIHAQNAGIFCVFSQTQLQNLQLQNLPTLTDLPKNWQQILNVLAKILNQQMLSISQHKLPKPLIFSLQKLANNQIQPKTEQLNHNDDTQALNDFHQKMQQYQSIAPILIGCYPMIANLPTGRQPALRLDIRCTQPKLHLSLILPYRLSDFALFPFVSNQNHPNGENFVAIQAFVWQLYQTLAPLKLLNGQWADYWLDNLTSVNDNWTTTPIKQQKTALAKQLTIQLFAPTSHNQSAIGVNINMPKFDVKQVLWQGFDLPKYVLDIDPNKRAYLQVFAPTRLLNDELLTQAQATANLYHHGKVVWGVVLKADNTLSKADELQGFDRENLHTAEILYDPTGQTSIDQLLAFAKPLQALAQQDLATLNQLPTDQAFFSMHFQDERSRIFGHAYPDSLTNATNSSVKINNPIKISSLWIWRPHLPNAMLTLPILPIIVNQQANLAEMGRIMALPGIFWQQKDEFSKQFYQYWLAKGLTQFEQNLEVSQTLIATKIHQVQQHKSLENRLYPRFKATKTPNQQATMHTTPSANTKISTNTEVSITKNKTATINDSHNQNHNQKVALTPQLQQTLQQQLLANQARLQSSLSTTDKDKERKLYIIGAVVAVVVILTFIMASLLK
ncbi:hypothetical protein MOMA_05661 [Moraxella macacae 0408225]|uniref:Uncharacterized protein n=1 Tax=Moraxella macacae 0408225 TaxID=1230338 RepID=L2F4T5_9GAMM|nr:hypothetical protein [Moraxella macacae]ELA08022.1 hypothetical protein MOMA_05661 [Moraxella macacae 0408225]